MFSLVPDANGVYRLKYRYHGSANIWEHEFVPRNREFDFPRVHPDGPVRDYVSDPQWAAKDWARVFAPLVDFLPTT